MEAGVGGRGRSQYHADDVPNQEQKYYLGVLAASPYLVSWAYSYITVQCPSSIMCATVMWRFKYIYLGNKN